MDQVELTLQQHILERFLPGEDASKLTRDTPLISGGVLDSLATVQLGVFIEEHFKVILEPHEVSIDYMDTIASIADLVRTKRGDA